MRTITGFGDLTAKPNEKVTYHGKTFDQRAVGALMECERRLGYELTILQGSFSSGVQASAGVHDGGGAVDLAPAYWQDKIAALRRVGWAAWYRTPSQGPWPAHVHGVLLDDKLCSPGAKSQWAAYRNYRDGLAGNEPDRQKPHPDGRVFHYTDWLRDARSTDRRSR